MQKVWGFRDKKCGILCKKSEILCKKSEILDKKSEILCKKCAILCKKCGFWAKRVGQLGNSIIVCDFWGLTVLHLSFQLCPDSTDCLWPPPPIHAPRQHQ